MIIFLLFISFYLGNVLTSALLILLVVTTVFLLFVLKKYRLIYFLISLGGVSLGFLSSCIKINSLKSSYSGIVYSVKENYFLLNSRGERLYVYAKNHSYDLGDYLSVTGEKAELEFVTLESNFDFKSYLNKRGVFHALDAKKIEIKWHNFVRINEAREKVLSHFNQDERSIIGAILFSDGGESDTSEALTNLHLARFLSASGLYVSLFAVMLNYILKLFMKGKYGELITISLLTIYLVFTIPKFTVLRVVLILLLKWINHYPLKKKFSYLEVLSFAGILCLLFDHYLAYQDSFILGFSIPVISYLTRNIFASSKVKSYLMRALTIYLFFIPFEALYYNKIVILSFPLQIISTPLFLLIGIVSLLCFFKIPLYSFDKLLVFLLKGYTGLIKPLSFGPFLPAFTAIALLIYYFLYLVYLYYLTIGYKPLRRGSIISLVGIVILYALPIKNRLSSEVDFINVGQGDCTLIRDHQKVVLIDTGGLTNKDIANDTLIPYLKKKRIYKIDSVFITHYDYDHYGALENLQKAYKIAHIYDYYSSYPINIGRLTFNNYNTYGLNSKEENDRSLVLSFYVANKAVIVMGDAPSWVEKEIIKNNESLNCDILKVGHHGSDSSSCEEFIQYVKPKEAVISCGKNNRYGHPSKSVLNTLNKYQIKIRRTDLEGTITYAQIFV